jgi:hypothetical protein
MPVLVHHHHYPPSVCAHDETEVEERVRVLCVRRKESPGFL